MKRIEWVDIARGIGIILVILGHIGIGKVGKFIYSFHIPLFFFLSGFCFSGNNIDIKSFFKKKIKKLIIPYVFLGIVICTIEVIFMKQSPKIFLEILMQRRMFSIWFITCLFLCDIIFLLFIKVSKNNLLKLFNLSIIASILGAIYIKLKMPILPWNLDLSMVVMIIFYFGYWFKCNEYKFGLKNSTKYLMFFVMLITNVTITILNLKFYGKTLDLYHSELANPILSVISAISGIIVVVIVSKFIEKYNLMKNILKSIGENSLVYFSLHQVVVFSLVNRIFELFNIFNRDILFDKLLSKLILFVSVFIILKPIIEFMKKTKLKIFLGL